MSLTSFKGTIDFRHDAVNDIVIARPRWTLDSAIEVMRWYQMQASYFGQRFHERKDVIMVNDAFDVTPRVATLWGQYRAKLHETYIRFSVRVNNGPRVRLATNTSAARYTISSLECETVEAAIEAILGARAEQPTKVPSGIRPRPSGATARPSSSRPPPKASEG